MSTPALTLRDVRKTYANGFEALRGIDLEVAEGEFFALLGPNGAGKSTTIGIICSLVRKTSGMAQVFGYDLDTELSAAKRCIGLVPQEFNFNQFEPVAEIVINQAGYYGLPRELARQRAETYLQAARPVGEAPANSAATVRRHETPADDCPGAGA